MKLRFSSPSFKYYNGTITVCSYNCDLVGEDGQIIESFVAKGKSVKAPQDDYNENIARHLADSRAKEKAYSIIARRMTSPEINAAVAKIQEAIKIVSFYKKIHYLRKEEQEHIKEIIG